MVTRASSKSRPRVFISSTVLDLPEHRDAAVEACLRVGVVPLAMEGSSASDSDPRTQSSTLLDQADIFIGILTFRYGFVPPGQEKSLAEIEYERAVERGIPCLVFLMSADHPVRALDVETGHGAEKLQSFKAAVHRSSFVAEFRSADELKAAIVTGLVEVLRIREPEPPTALLLLPFGKAHEYLRNFLSSELERKGVRVLRLDAMRPGAFWVNEVANAIQSADFVIADVTDASPNVMYELGYVHALRRPVIMLADSEAIRSVPSDLLGYQLLTYDKRELRSLEKPLARFPHEYAKEGRR